MLHFVTAGQEFRVRWNHNIGNVYVRQQEKGWPGTTCQLQIFKDGKWVTTNSASTRLHSDDEFCRAKGRWYSFDKLMDPKRPDSISRLIRDAAWEAFFKAWPSAKKNHPKTHKAVA